MTLVGLGWLVLLVITFLSMVTVWEWVLKSSTCELSWSGGFLFEMRKTHPTNRMLVIEAMVRNRRTRYSRPCGLRQTEYNVVLCRLYIGCHDRETNGRFYLPGAFDLNCHMLSDLSVRVTDS